MAPKDVGNLSYPLEVSMWLSIWVVTIAMAVGFAVMAMSILPKEQRATLER
jgi:hypothetical protein